MGKPLRVVIVEDVEQDAALALLALSRAGYEPTHRRVETREQLEAALTDESWDIVLSDYNLPGFDARAALAVVQRLGIDVPFLIVSGTVGEDTAVEAMHAGAHDYFVKGNLRRLGAAVDRELREANERAARRRADEELKRAEAERRSLQLQLLQMDRMVSMGMLAAAVAHEINNPLAYVIANLEDVVERLGEIREGSGEQLAGIRQAIVESGQGARRVADIVRSLKTFSRVDEETIHVIDVCQVLDSSSAMAAAEIKHRARLVKDYQGTPHVRANETRLGQVALNLIINAAHAIVYGNINRDEIRVHSRTDNGFVFIEVSDTGSGVPPEIREKIFEPFFTTKPLGHGTGLGLSICRQIVRDLGGEITVASELGKGTTFTVRLPAAPALATGTTNSDRPASTRRARVLYIDDEPNLGKAVQRLLARHHDVEVHCSGRAALARLEQGERYDAILCDLMMPDLTGMDLHNAIRCVAADQARRMIFLSGGAYAPEARAFLDIVDNPRLDKPINRRALLEQISAMMEGRLTSDRG